MSLDIIVSLFIFWSIALAPPLVTRFLLLKKPMGKIGAWIFVVLFWFINFMAQYFTGVLRQEVEGGGPPKPGTIGLFLMGWATYTILKYNKK